MLKKILENWAQALGGRDKLEALQSIYRVLEFHVGGIPGIRKEWQQTKGPYRMVSELGTYLRTITVFDGQRAWIQDNTGHVRELRGPELGAVVTSAYLGSYSHLVPGRLPGTIEYLGEESDAQGAYHVLQIHPENGNPIKAYLDSTTYLPARYEYTLADQSWQVLLSDYREVEGLKIAHQIYRTCGDPRSDMREMLKEIKLNPQLDPTLFQKPAETFKYRFTTSPPIQIFLKRQGNLLYAPVFVNQQGPLDFLLDTGATGSLLDAAQAQQLGLVSQGELSSRGAVQAIGMSLTRASSVGLPGLELEDYTLGVIDLAPLRKMKSLVRGILGYDFFRRFVVELDYKRQKMIIYDPQSYQYEGDGQVLELVLEFKLPCVRAKIEGQYEGLFLVDTGFSDALMLARSFMEEHRLPSPHMPTVPVPVFGIAGHLEGRAGRLNSLSLGALELLQPVVHFFPQNLPQIPEAAGVLGSELLRRLRVIFDYPQARLILEPNEDFLQPFEHDMSGITLLSEDDVLRVEHIVAGSPGAEAGVQVGDLLLTIDGQSTAEMGLEQVEELLKSKPGRKFRLRLRRGEQELEVVIELRRLI